MSALLENIEAIVAIVIAVCGFFYMSLRDFRKEMREDMGKLREEVKQDIGELRKEMSAMSRLMMLCLIDPIAAKKQAIADLAKEQPADPPKPKE